MAKTAVIIAYILAICPIVVSSQGDEDATKFTDRTAKAISEYKVFLQAITTGSHTNNEYEDAVRQLLPTIRSLWSMYAYFLSKDNLDDEQREQFSKLNAIVAKTDVGLADLASADETIVQYYVDQRNPVTGIQNNLRLFCESSSPDDQKIFLRNLRDSCKDIDPDLFFLDRESDVPASAAARVLSNGDKKLLSSWVKVITADAVRAMSMDQACSALTDPPTSETDANVAIDKAWMKMQQVYEDLKGDTSNDLKAEEGAGSQENAGQSGHQGEQDVDNLEGTAQEAEDDGGGESDQSADDQTGNDPNQETTDDAPEPEEGATGNSEGVAEETEDNAGGENDQSAHDETGNDSKQETSGDIPEPEESATGNSEGVAEETEDNAGGENDQSAHDETGNDSKQETSDDIPEPEESATGNSEGVAEETEDNAGGENDQSAHDETGNDSKQETSDDIPEPEESATGNSEGVAEETEDNAGGENDQSADDETGNDPNQETIDDAPEPEEGATGNSEGVAEETEDSAGGENNQLADDQAGNDHNQETTDDAPEPQEGSEAQEQRKLENVDAGIEVDEKVGDESENSDTSQDGTGSNPQPTADDQTQDYGAQILSDVKSLIAQRGITKNIHKRIYKYLAHKYTDIEFGSNILYTSRFEKEVFHQDHVIEIGDDKKTIVVFWLKRTNRDHQRQMDLKEYVDSVPCTDASAAANFQSETIRMVSVTLGEKGAHAVYVTDGGSGDVFLPNLSLVSRKVCHGEGKMKSYYRTIIVGY